MQVHFLLYTVYFTISRLPVLRVSVSQTRDAETDVKPSNHEPLQHLLWCRSDPEIKQMKMLLDRTTGALTIAMASCRP